MASELKGVTPGEWKAAYPAGYVIAGDWPSGVTVMIAGGAPESERMANALLMAQAKRLYAALGRYRKGHQALAADESGDPEAECICDACTEARAVLAAARGEEPNSAH